MTRLLLTLRLLPALALIAAYGCTCTPPTGDAGVVDEGRVFARAAAGGGVEIVLEDLTTPLRTLQVDVVLTGAQASDVVAAGPVSFNVLEGAFDGPRSELTLVVADTRRLPLNNGPIARLVTDGAATVTLSNALAVDDDGERRTLATGTD